MPQDAPVCAKCNRRHWAFQDCSKGRPVEVVRQPLPEGVRAWGDHGETYHHVGDNVFVLDPHKRAEPNGSVTPPKAA